MKKKFLALFMVLCLSLSLVPAAFAAEDTTDLQQQINDATAGETVELTDDVTISQPLTINKQLTLDGNGHTLTMTGSGYAIVVSTDSEVTVQELNVEATASGGRGIQMGTANPHFTLKDSTLNVNNRGIGFTDNGTTSGAVVTVDNSTIQNSQKPADKTYENWSHQGDTRGIAIWNNKGITIDIKNHSKILGFGYPINMAGDVVNGVRDMENSTINITDSDVWGWCALNIWTIDTTFNITNSNLKGFVETDNPWNSFATIVLNEDIYGNITDNEKANVFNISGGSVTSDCVSNDDEVFHCLFRLDEEFMSEFHFYEDEDTMEKVDLYCKMPFSAFVLTYDEMTMEGFTTWAQTKLSCSSNDTTYNWSAIAPGVNVDAANALMLQNVIPVEADGVDNEGGQMQ